MIVQSWVSNAWFQELQQSHLLCPVLSGSGYTNPSTLTYTNSRPYPHSSCPLPLLGHLLWGVRGAFSQDSFILALADPLRWQMLLWRGPYRRARHNRGEAPPCSRRVLRSPRTMRRCPSLNVTPETAKCHTRRWGYNVRWRIVFLPCCCSPYYWGHFTDRAHQWQTRDTC